MQALGILRLSHTLHVKSLGLGTYDPLWGSVIIFSSLIFIPQRISR